MRGRDRGGAAARKLDEAAPLDGERAAPLAPPGAVPAAGAADQDEGGFDGQYRVKLESFEGPLDLLLHLIQQHELDILDIPVSFITAKYLEYLKLMQVLSIEIASEYLVMAATLVHIKSKMLLPAPPPGQDDGMPQEEEEDPRSELVRRLLEYQKYKAAAAELAERGTLGRDVFARGVEEASEPGPAPFARVEVFGLLEAFEKILKKSKVKIDHEVVFDRISITDRIVELTERLEGRRAVRFEWLFLAGVGSGTTRFDLVITFLAMLEMCRMKLLRVYQTGPLAPIYMGLIEEGAELSEEDRALADHEATRVMEAAPEEPESKPQSPEQPVAGPEQPVAEPEQLSLGLALGPEQPVAQPEPPSAEPEQPIAVPEQLSLDLEQPPTEDVGAEEVSPEGAEPAAPETPAFAEAEPETSSTAQGDTPALPDEVSDDG